MNTNDSLDCDDIDGEDVQKSKLLFENATSWEEFLDIWSKFYVNEVCIPTYMSKFIGGPDNDQADLKTGLLFQKITKNGFLPIESQATIPGSQKEYVEGFVRKYEAPHLVNELNRFENIVAWWNEIDASSSLQGLCVTYDSSLKPDKNTKTMIGNPFSFIGRSNAFPVFEDVRSWMYDDLKYQFTIQDFVHVVVINTSFHEKSNYALNCILKAQERTNTFFRLERAAIDKDYKQVARILEKNPRILEMDDNEESIMVSTIINADSREEMMVITKIFLPYGQNFLHDYMKLKEDTNVPQDVLDIIWNKLQIK